MEKISEECDFKIPKDNQDNDNELDDFTYKDIEIKEESITNKISDEEFDGTKIGKVYDYVKKFEWSKEMEEEAKKIVDENSEVIQDRFIDMQARNWDKFYKHNTTNFFKDRHYILAEFPELKDDKKVSLNLNL